MTATLVQLTGLVCLTVAAFLVTPALGFAVAGVALVIIGLALDPGSRIRLPEDQAWRS